MLRSQCLSRLKLTRLKNIQCTLRSKTTNAPSKQPLLDPKDALKSGAGLVLVKLLGATGAVGGVIGGYSYYDSNFRSLLEENVPYSREALQYIFGLFSDEDKKDGDDTKPGIQSKGSNLTLSAATSMEETQLAESTKPVEMLGKRWEVELKVAPEKQLDKKAEEKKLKEESQKRDAEFLRQQMISKEKEEASENEDLREYVKASVEKVKTLVKNTTDLQNRLISVTREQTSQLKKAIDDSVDIMTKDEQWQAVVESFKEREALEAQCEEAQKATSESLALLKQTVEDSKSRKETKRNACLSSALDVVSQSRKDMSKLSIDVAKARTDAKMVLLTREMIDKARRQFKEELEAIEPDVVIGDKNAKKLTEDQLNSLLVHAYRRMNQMQKQLSAQIALEEQRIREVLEEQQATNEVTNAEHAKQLMEAQHLEFDAELRQVLVNTSLEYERDMLHQLTRQAAAHSDHLKDVLTVQEIEIEDRSEMKLNAALIQERQAFQAEMASWLARLKGIESAVDGRAEQEKVARLAQALWLSCAALNYAITHGDEDGWTWEQQLLPLTKQVEAVRNAAMGHLFVETILKSMPDEARSRGVWTEENLQSRFTRVKKICERVAMIDEYSNRTLFQFVVSYIQSFFIFTSPHAKAADDLVDVNDLDTFACLVHAQYWLNEGNLENALRFMNQLRGESLSVARDWIKEAKLLTETRQVTRTLTAFASASGLGTIF